MVQINDMPKTKKKSCISESLKNIFLKELLYMHKSDRC